MSLQSLFRSRYYLRNISQDFDNRLIEDFKSYSTGLETKMESNKAINTFNIPQISMSCEVVRYGPIGGRDGGKEYDVFFAFSVPRNEGNREEIDEVVKILTDKGLGKDF